MTDNSTYIGYVREIIGDRLTIKKNLEFKFVMVVDHGEKVGDEWHPNKVLYTVVAYTKLAHNIMATFARQPKQGVGLRLIVVGKPRNDSFRATGGYNVPRQSIVANYAGPDLNWSIAAVVPMGPDATDEALAANTPAQEPITAAA
ncbi:hypothetical protein [Alloactinosynnema sp. L-07]|uniref:hypothetical protein n=1 Tax=Alloactinosynnema sp. L-07 TaxID=1653480 RepID=UPI00065F0902|nr:hypothetical protein [Alloactinosynnema sp. L-07]CRK56984.1 hypothetical protein [Alloactinosynnema sp. L-07]